MLLLPGCAQKNESEEYDAFAQNVADVYMCPPGTQELKEICGKKWMTSGEISIRKVPSNKEEEFVYNSLGAYRLVEPQYVVWAEDYEKDSFDDMWVLIRFESAETLLNAVGWVQLNELEEYTEESRYKCSGPLDLKEGTVDLDTGKKVEFIQGVFIDKEYDDSVRTVSAGGNFARVKREDLIYPET